MSVKAKLSKTSLLTYPLGEPERNPLFFEKRVYQGSSGRVYPLPFVDKVYDDPVDREYQLATLENEYVYLEMLPEIGGRIFKGQDKTNSNYDFFYRQDVIKPALVGLAGPWLSGGVEFNWPQHHRPGTYMPTDVFIEEETDGARTIWMSELDPLHRMKGMHGVRLRPGSSLLELRVQLFNRTPITQTFLWWANVAAKVHDNYQSFFPPDVHYVADHAVWAMSSFPLAENDYYGVDYASRSGANDLSWYKNIPVPTSYMVCETKGGFFGGYDFDADGGFVHVANKHISPGKKQWTWGNHDFGWAWDRELTDEGGPYVELMAGVYTDNQPDFSYLLPYETKTFSQFWWPIQKTGPVQEANEEVAIRFLVNEDRHIELCLNVSRSQEKLRIVVLEGDNTILDTNINLLPGGVWFADGLVMAGEDERSLSVSVLDAMGKRIGHYRPVGSVVQERSRELAKEPNIPIGIDSIEELYLVGEHLEQARHPTRDPELYWNEGLKRDPENALCNLALGKASLKRGEFHLAKKYLFTAIRRLTQFHPNPSTGEAYYYAGLCERYLDNTEASYELFYKATWNYEWRSASYYSLACIDCRRGDFYEAIENARSSLKTNTENNSAMILIAYCLKKLNRGLEASAVLVELTERDYLDAWANWELVKESPQDSSRFQQTFRNDAQTILDVAFELASIGAYADVVSLLDWHCGNAVEEVVVPNPLQRSQSILFLKAWALSKLSNDDLGDECFLQACAQSPDYFFPSRLEEQLLLEWALEWSKHWIVRYGLGNYYYDKRRHEDAISVWEEASTNGGNATVHRNLGIAYWNSRRDGVKARTAYQKSILLDRKDARLIFEYDQLRKKLGDSTEDRLETLELKVDIVLERDDSCVEYATMLNEVGRHQDALDLLNGRRFHPWEGGEGKVLRQYTNAKLGLGITCLKSADSASALCHFEEAFDTPRSLGEAYHPLQSKADVNLWIGRALKSLGKIAEAATAFAASANENADFKDMAVVAYSEISYFQGLSLIELGQLEAARSVFQGMIEFTEAEKTKEAKIDYFATSLPNLLVFEDGILETRDTHLDRLRYLALDGFDQLNRRAETS